MLYHTTNQSIKNSQTAKTDAPSLLSSPNAIPVLTSGNLGVESVLARPGVHKPNLKEF